MSWVMRNKPPVKCVAVGSWHKHPTKVRPEHVSEDMSSVSYQFEDGTIFSYTHLFNLPEAVTGEKLWVMCKRGGFDLMKAEMYAKAGNKTTSLGRPLNAREWDNGTKEHIGSKT